MQPDFLKVARSRWLRSESGTHAFLLLACLVVGVATLTHTVQSISHYVAYYDEGATILAVQRLAETGIPQMRPPADSPNYDPAFPYLTLWEYAVECLWRLPFYLLSKLTPFNWGTTSSVVFALLMFAWLSLKALRANDQLFLTPMSAGLFILLFCASPYSATEFHYVRYYPLVLVATAAAHLLASSALVAAIQRQQLPFAVLAFGSAPAFFHMTGLVYFSFWLTVLYVMIMGGARHLSARQSAGAAAVGALALGAIAIIVWEYRIFLSIGFEPNVIARFFSLNSGSRPQLWLLLAITATGAITSRALVPFEQKLLVISWGALSFCLLAYAVGASRYILYNPYMYLLFLHPIWIIIVALSVISVIKTIAALSPRPALTASAMFLLCAATAWYLHPVSSFFNDPHNVTRSDLVELQRIVDRTPDIVFFADETFFFFNNFPSKPAFLFRAHRPAEEVAAMNSASAEGFVRLGQLVDTRGFVRATQGEVYAGNLTSFCAALALYPKSKVAFFKVKPGSLEPLLAGRVAPFLNAPTQVDAAELQRQVCS